MSAIRNGAALACLTAAIGLLWSRTPTAQTRGALATIVPGLRQTDRESLLPRLHPDAAGGRHVLRRARGDDPGGAGYLRANSAAERAVTQAWTAVGITDRNRDMKRS